MAVGSTNPIKIAAVEAVIDRLCHGKSTIISVRVPSGVPDQPWGDYETRSGAINRAKAALSQTQADLGIGLEGGILQVEESFYTSGWCAIVNREGLVSTAGGANVPLPDNLLVGLQKGAEMGPAMDHLSGKNHTAEHAGTIGILTQNYVTRQLAFEQILTFAFAPLLNPHVYPPSQTYPKKDTIL